MQKKIKEADAMTLQEKAKQLRIDIINELYEAQSGHPGGSLSCIDTLIALYYNVMNIRPDEPHWEDRDRFVLSKGHCCPALYAVLADKGYFDKSELATLRKYGSHLQGHPDMRKTPGIDANTGSLGQGIAIAMGMAVAAKHGGKSYHVYTMVGDGECQEGLVWEASMAAAHYKLDNFTVILDHNGLQIDGRNDDVLSLGDICGKFAAFGFDTFKVDGHDIDAVTAALKAPHTPGRPKFICCETVKGKGVSFMENNAGWHGSTIKTADYEAAIKELEAL